MMDNYIQLNKKETLKLGIRDDKGEPTGEFLEFNLGDIELPLRYQEMIEADKKNKSWLRNQLVIIEKRQDVKGKKLLSKNEEDKIKEFNEFYKKEVEIYNMFLGKNGVQKLLNGAPLTWDSLSIIDELIETQIIKYLDLDMKRITEKVKEKYGKFNKENEEVLK